MSHFTWESANTDVSCQDSNYFSTTIIDNRHDNITTTERASPIDRPNNTNTFPVKCLQTIQDYSPLQTTTSSFLITRLFYIARQLPPLISSLLLASTIVLSVYFLMRAENYNVTLHLGICKY